MLKSLVAAAAMSIAALMTSVGTAHAVTYNCSYVCADGAGNESNLGAPDLFTIEVNGGASDTGGLLGFGFNIIADLVSVETNSLNPISGFVDATVEWNTAADGTGTVLASLTTAQLIAGQAMTLAHSVGDVVYLVLRWSDVSVNGSNFDVRVETSPVPVPPALLLLGSGLLGMGFLGRRRKASAKIAA